MSVLREYERPYSDTMSASVYSKQEVGPCIKAIMLPATRRVSYGEKAQGNGSHEFEGGDRTWSHD